MIDGERNRHGKVNDRLWQGECCKKAQIEFQKIASLRSSIEFQVFAPSYLARISYAEHYLCQKRRDKFLVQAVMGSGKSLMAVINCLNCWVLPHSQQHESLCKHLILCYNLEASRGIKDLLDFKGIRCEEHKARSITDHKPSDCPDCREAKKRAIKNSPLCCAVGLKVEDVEKLECHVFILGGKVPLILAALYPPPLIPLYPLLAGRCQDARRLPPMSIRQILMHSDSVTPGLSLLHHKPCARRRCPFHGMIHASWFIISMVHYLHAHTYIQMLALAPSHLTAGS